MPPTLADVLTGMDPVHRNLVSAAFGDMDTKMAALHASNSKNKERVSELETASSVDKDLLKQQITQFLSQISESTRARYAMADTDAVSNTLCGDNADSMRRTVDKLLMCCSSVMFDERAGAGPVTPKRRHEEDIADVSAPPAPAPARFEPGDKSASSKLRDALSAFNNT